MINRRVKEVLIRELEDGNGTNPQVLIQTLADAFIERANDLAADGVFRGEAKLRQFAESLLAVDYIAGLQQLNGGTIMEDFVQELREKTASFRI